jgi:hypothetical protein
MKKIALALMTVIAFSTVAFAHEGEHADAATSDATTTKTVEHKATTKKGKKSKKAKTTQTTESSSSAEGAAAAEAPAHAE